MKTHTIKIPTAELMIVELPEEVKLWEFLDGKFWIDDKQIFVKGFTPFHTLLGKPDEISEEDAAQLIPMYFDHEKTAVEHLIQMIQSEIYWDVNPMGKEPQYIPDLSEFTVIMRKRHQKWKEAEQKTFDRNRSVIFKKKI